METRAITIVSESGSQVERGCEALVWLHQRNEQKEVLVVYSLTEKQLLQSQVQNCKLSYLR